MAIHEELNPDAAALPYLTARSMRVLATDNAARTAGVIVVPNLDGTDTVLGTNGLAPWVGDTTPPGRPLDIEATSHLGTALIRWDGALEGGIPSDFRCVRIWAKPVDATAEAKTLVGELSSAGEVNTGVFDAGTTLDVWATALDNAHDRDGLPAYNESVESMHVTVEILPIVSQQEFDEAADNILAAADESVKAQIEQVNKDLDATSDRIDTKAQEILEAAKADATAKADAVDAKVQQANTKVQANADAIKQEADRFSAYKTEADKAMADLDKTVDEHGTVLAQVDKDLAQAKKDLLTIDGKADSAVSTANNADTNAANAVSTANTAAGNAASAVEIAKQSKDQTVTGSVIEYAIGGATAAPTTGWTTGNVTRPAGATVWMRTKITYGDGHTTVTGATPVTGDAGPKGDKGEPGGQGTAGAPGAAGVSVTAITPYYQLALSAPAKPAGKNPEGGWSLTEPAYVKARSLYTTSRVDYSNGQWAWTDVVKSAAYEASAAAITAAEDAKLTADNAQTTANTAESNSQTAMSGAATATSIAEGAAKEATQATATANSAAQTATSTQRALDLARQNAAELLFNGGFEAGADGWQTNVANAGFTQQSGYCRSGSWRAYLNGSRGTRELVSTHPVAVTVGNRYRFRVWYKLLTALSGNDNGGLRLQYSGATSVADAQWQDFKPLVNLVFTGDTWTEAVQEVVIPAGVKWVRARIAFTTPVDAFFDDCSIIDSTHIHELELAAAQAQKTAEDAAVLAANADAKALAADQKAIDAGDKAVTAQTTADSKNRVFITATDPTEDPQIAGKLKPGDLWWQTSDKAPETYWTGEANNSVSVLVDHSDEIVHMWIWNGARWNNHVLYAQDILVNGSIVTELLAADCVEARHIKVGAIEADKLAATALYGKVIKGGVFLTSNERLVIDNEGLLLKDAGGNATITMLASNGSATFRDVSIIGGSLTTPSLTSSEINGGTIDGATVTGSTVQTVHDTNRGIKLSGGNLDIYRSDKTRFLRANEAGMVINDGAKDVLSFAPINGKWVLSLAGAVQSGGEISGAAITGPIIRTNTEWDSDDQATACRGITITDGGLFAFKNNGKKEYSLAFNAVSGELVLDGAVQANSVLMAPRIEAGEVIGANIVTSTDADNRVALTSSGLTVTHGGQTVISFAADGAVDLGMSGIAADSRVTDLTEEVRGSYTPRNEFEQTTGGLSQSVSDIKDQADATADRLADEIDERKQYMRFDPNTGLVIGDLTQETAYSVQLTSTAMQFRAGDTVAAYVSNDRLYINNAQVVNTLRIGNFAFLPRDNGHMSLQYVGGTTSQGA